VSVALRALLGVALLLLLGCASAYQRTYDAETQKLETQQQAHDAQERAAHAEAQRYAAVVYFESGSSRISDDGQRELRWFVDKMQPYPQAVVLVQGFADATGGDALNQDLSRDRADAVASYLATQGIEGRRLEVTGFGSNYEAAPNASAKGRRSNRRVEVTVK
jgi:outer membrane protein OmpA-like peptidoglycan-associated protein